MNETKKGLRITAGVLLLVLACFSVFSVVTTYVSVREHVSEFALSLCLLAVDAVLEILIAVFLLARKFTVSAVFKCVLLVAPFVMGLVNAALQRGGFSLDTIREYWTGTPLNGLIQLAGTAASVLIIVGLFLHSRKAKPLIIVGAVLSLLETLAQLGYSLKDIAGSAGTIGMTVGAVVVPALIMFTAWILLAVYFGAQKRAAE